MPVLSDDLDVMRVRGQRFVLHERAADLLRCCTIGGIHLLLVGGSGIFVGIALIGFGIVRRRLLILLYGAS